MPAWTLPPHPLRPRAVAATVAGVCLSVVGAVVTARALDLPASAVVTTLAVTMAILGVGLGRMQPFHPFPTLGPAHLVTMLRAIGTALVVGLCAGPAAPVVASVGAGLGAVVGALDGVDGWLARRTRLSSAFGARFDMEVDALLVLALSTMLWRHGKAGAWVLLAGALRYGFVAAAAPCPWLRQALFPSWRRKAVCVLQVAGLSALLLPAVPSAVSAPTAALLVATLVWSFGVDVAWLWRHRA